MWPARGALDDHLVEGELVQVAARGRDTQRQAVDDVAAALGGHDALDELARGHVEQEAHPPQVHRQDPRAVLMGQARRLQEGPVAAEAHDQ